MQPDVTVLIAAFNAEETLADAIASALAQRDVSLEVVVVDDASGDRTLEIANSFADPRVRVFALPANRGPGGARNAGLREAAGRWIAVLDSDDTMLPDRMARMIARGTEANAQIVVDNLLVANDDEPDGKAMFATADLARHREITLAEYIVSNRFFEETFNFGYMKPLFERAFLEQNNLGYDQSLRIGEDFLLMAEALAVGARCAVEPVPGYLYGIRDGSISRKLELHYLRAIQASDERFRRNHVLDGDALRALDLRRRSLEQAVSYVSVVQHLKDRSFLHALRTACRDPGAMRHLRLPIGVRLRRLAGAS